MIWSQWFQALVHGLTLREALAASRVGALEIREAVSWSP